MIVAAYHNEVPDWVSARLPWISRASFTPHAVGIGVFDGPSILCGVVYDLHMPKADGCRGNVELTIAADDPRWCKRSVIRAIFHHPFNVLGVGRVSTLTPSRNKRALKLCRGMGFKHEGTLRELFSRRNHGVVSGMLRHECRWIDE